MKTKLFTLLVLAVSTLFSLTSCNQEIVSNPDDFTVSVSVADVGMPRAIATLQIEGDNTRPFTINYAVDGNAAMRIVRVTTPNYISSDGKDWIEQAANNCPNGSDIWVGLRLNHIATAYFAMPELEPGSHSIDITLTNEDGVSKSATAQFNL